MKDFLKSRWLSVLIYVTFLVVTYVTIMPLKTANAIYGQGDLLFHLNRITGLAEGLKAGTIPYRMFDVLSNLGSAVNFFYPFVFMLGFAALFIVVPNLVTAFYIGEALMLLATLVVAYRVMMSFSSNQRGRSVLFAFLYAYAGYRNYLAFDQFVLGEALAYIFIPIALLGFYNVFLGDAKKWVPLTAGLALISYAHMLSTLLVLVLFVFLVLIMLIGRKIEFSKVRIFALLKAILLTLLLVSVIYVPFIYQMHQTEIITTIQQPVAFFGGLGENLQNSLDAKAQNIGPLGVLAVIIAFVQVFKKKWQLNVVFGMLGAGLFIMGTTIFPWRSLDLNVQYVIQFPYRLFGLASFFLAVYLSGALLEMLNTPRQRRWTIVLFSAFSVLMTSSKIYDLMYARKDQAELVINDRFNAPDVQLETSFKANSNDLKLLNQSRHDYIGSVDYGPKDVWKTSYIHHVMAHEVWVDGKEHKAQDTYSLTNATFNIRLKKANQVDVPIFHYGNEIVKVDGKTVPAKLSQRGTTLVSVDKGTHEISVSYVTPKWLYLPWISALFGWLIVVVLYAVNLIKKRR
ncbi:hypothetical protein ACAW68_03905 [Weissella confusa]|uniref:hypothetical protein n=1 Tax=Weissella confusa TaxID=1583 RepID=UPI0035A3C7FE